MIRKLVFFLICFIVPCLLHSQDIKVPEEKITGENLRIEKSEIFIKPSGAPQDIMFPQIPLMPEEKVFGEGEQEDVPVAENEEIESSPFEKKHRNYIGVTSDNNNGLGLKIFCPVVAGDVDRLFDVDGFYTGGYRDNDEAAGIRASYSFKNKTDKFSAGIRTGYLYMPGSTFLPLDFKRDYFSVSTSLSHHWDDRALLDIQQSFYSIDGRESNYGTADLFFDVSGVVLNTGVERYNVFSEEFSQWAFSEAIWVQGRNFKIGGSMKKIEDYDLKFLPAVEYTPVAGLSFGFNGFYRIPDLWENLMCCNYKEMKALALAPEEEYRFNVSFSREREHRGFKLELARTYTENTYTWTDMDANGLFEPLAAEFITTSLRLDVKHLLFKNITFFFEGERNFYDRDVYFYPDAKHNAGFIWRSSATSCKIWASYTGDRIFPMERLNDHTVFNAEVKFLQNKKVEWTAGIYNIGYKKYSLVPGYPAEGRKVLAGVKFYF